MSHATSPEEHGAEEMNRPESEDSQLGTDTRDNATVDGHAESAESTAFFDPPRCPEPAERPDVWPWSAKRRDDGTLEIGGVALTDIALTHGTPVFVLDTEDLAGRARVWASVMNEEFWDGYGMAGGDAYYAGKAFLSAEVAREVVAQGMGIDTASLGELTLALRAGVEPSLIGLHGNNKSDEEIRLALEAKIHRVFIDSMDEVEQVERIASECGCIAPVMVRVKCGIHAGGNEYIATAHEDQKFGVSIADGQAMDVIRRVRDSEHLNFLGVHSHIGSQIHGAAAFLEAARIVMKFVASIRDDLGVATGAVDLGGGVGIAYTGEDPRPLRPIDLARPLAHVIRQECQQWGLPIPHVSVEPGRSIAGPAMVTLYRVGVIKDVTLPDGGVRRYVAVDGGMSDNIRPALYGARYVAALANRRPTDDWVRGRIVGKHCESGDIIIDELRVPADLRSGDLLAVPATGAYGYSMASNYNMLTKPGVLAVSGGDAHWMIRPQTIDDLIAYDQGLTEK
ncbi:diaminopimelate decarboxylase [Schaalia sp. ZJ405]|uniref:diaminopimelate decarboxylase n=1 Tax=Schaalia sp. ZJ405 TaxID=2709403 RepID=UPI001E4EF32D|nr:diaminopimelate decarboxylase [Schaalia sp. ZJ405]